jgi:hypothetical protein
MGSLGPDTAPPEVEDPDNISVQYAVDSFLVSCNDQYDVLLKSRLLPWCVLKGYASIRELDDLDVTTKFTESWVNLVPTKNRKGVALPTEPVALADTTKKTTLELFRSFRTTLHWYRERLVPGGR